MRTSPFSGVGARDVAEGHLDVFDKLCPMSWGGVSKASDSSVKSVWGAAWWATTTTD